MKKRDKEDLLLKIVGVIQGVQVENRISEGRDVQGEVDGACRSGKGLMKSEACRKRLRWRMSAGGGELIKRRRLRRNRWKDGVGVAGMRSMMSLMRMSASDM